MWMFPNVWPEKKMWHHLIQGISAVLLTVAAQIEPALNWIEPEKYLDFEIIYMVNLFE